MKVYRLLSSAALAGVLAMGAAANAAPITLVSDNFNSASDGALAGRSPDVGTNASYKWIVQKDNGTNGVAVQSGTLKTDMNLASAGGYGQANIQFDKGSYDLYTVQATINFGGAGSLNQMWVGFSNATNNPFNNSQLRAVVAANGGVTLTGLYESQGASKQDITTITSGTISSFSNSADYIVQLVYNAQTNKASVKVNNTTIINDVTPVHSAYLGGGAYTPALNYGDVTFRGFKNENNDATKASIDNFSITAESIPEPASLGLIGLGGMLLLRHRK